ncbi:hypothetical protein [Nitrococcus mobilis]|nr:hypothetical protein [Nitrococcus mobilis]
MKNTLENGMELDGQSVAKRFAMQATHAPGTSVLARVNLSELLERFRME